RVSEGIAARRNTQGQLTSRVPASADGGCEANGHETLPAPAPTPTPGVHVVEVDALPAEPARVGARAEACAHRLVGAAVHRAQIETEQREAETRASVEHLELVRIVNGCGRARRPGPQRT